MKTSKTVFSILLILTSIINPLTSTHAAGSVSIYTDSLVTSWQDWSYGGVTINNINSSPTHTGNKSISITYTDSWSGFQIGYHDAYLDVSTYDSLRFWINGGVAGGQTIVLQIGSIEKPITPQANTWTQVDIPLSSLGSPRAVYSITWFNNTAGAQSTFYLDDISFENGSTPPSSGSEVTLSVDAGSNRHAISPYIYGINFATETIAADLNLPVRRWGGNNTTRYNWQTDVSNTGSDWYFENIPQDNAHPELGSSADQFVLQNNRTNTETLMTIPMIGWAPKVGSLSHPYDCGFKVSLYGAQDSVDFWDTNCGDGIHNGINITNNNPFDTSTAITPAFVTSWIDHLTSTFGTASNGGVMFYNLDNEPMLWNSTHRDVHPTPVTYDELRDRTLLYAAAVKAADSSAQTLGPVLWGWCAYFYSAADGCDPGADRATHNNIDFIPWYLQQMNAYEQTHNIRILDYLDVHIYPQIDGVYSDSLGSTNVQAARLRSTRQLWDSTYTHEGWIAQPVYLIPRMHQWVANNYPNTKTAITEYNWGALGFMNGALAQADILGIFGREGLDLATLWDPPSDANAPGIFAFRMFRNYDGIGSTFGDNSVSASSTNQNQLAIYAAERSSDDALTLIIINKTGQSISSSISLSNFQPTNTAEVYRYSPINLNAIVHEANQTVSTSGFTATFPANSISMIVIPVLSTPPSSFNKTTPANGSTNVSSNVILSWNSSSGKTKYEYCYDTSNNNICDGIWTDAGNNTNIVLTDLTVGNTYYWHVRAQNTIGITYSDDDTWNSFTPQPTISGNVKTAGVAINYVNGTPKAVISDSDGNYSFIVPVNWSGKVIPTKNNFTFSPANKSYANVGTNQNMQNYIANFIRVDSSLSTPRLSEPINNLTINSQTFTFKWKAVQKAQAYEIMISLDRNFTNVLTDQIVTDPMYITALPLNEGKYYWRVRAQNASLQPGRFSSTFSFIIDTTPPVAPNLFAPANGATISITPTFKWTLVPWADNYQIQIDDDINFFSPEITISTGKVRTYRTVLPNGTYYWHVKAKDAAGNWGAWSTVFSIIKK